jgi:hypothetical protein
MKELQDSITPVVGPVVHHFNEIEKSLCDSKLSLIKVIEKVISPILIKIFQNTAARVSADVNSVRYKLSE